MVEIYLSTEISYQELALSVGINNPPVIAKWVNDFRIAGPDALRPKRKGRRSKVSKPKESKLTKIENVSNNSEYLKQLEDENFFEIMKQEMYYGVIYYSYEQIIRPAVTFSNTEKRTTVSTSANYILLLSYM